MKRVINDRNKKVLVSDLEEARSMKTRLIGLMGRAELKMGHGLWIAQSGNSIHSCFMKFPIDLVFVDKKGVVRHLVQHMKPWRLVVAPVLTMTDCLELPAGTVALSETQVGDTIRVEA